MSMKLKKDEVIDKVIELVRILNIQFVDGYDDVDFTRISPNKLNKLCLNELVVLYDIINNNRFYKQKILNKIKKYCQKYGDTKIPSINLIVTTATLTQLEEYSNEELLHITEQLIEQPPPKKPGSLKGRAKGRTSKHRKRSEEEILREIRMLPHPYREENKSKSPLKKEMMNGRKRSEEEILKEIRMLPDPYREEENKSESPLKKEVDNEKRRVEEEILEQIRNLPAPYKNEEFDIGFMEDENKNNDALQDEAIEPTEPTVLNNKDIDVGLEDLKESKENGISAEQELDDSDDDIEEDELSEDIRRIYELVEVMGIKQLPDLDIDFSTITKKELKHLYSSDDREFILDSLQQLFESGYRPKTTIVNPLEIIYKYKDGAVIEEDDLTSEEKTKDEDDLWRQEIPNFIKRSIPTWKTDSIEEFYNKAKSVLNDSAGESQAKIREFVSEFSQIMYEQEENEHEITEDDRTDSEIEAFILNTVEMIILPHVEVLEKIEKSGGNIQFVNVWNENFSEELKEKVKERDGWKCVVCEGETDLHVHHKIPRAKGGMNHKDNLVTLCASCHGVIETANVTKAYKKCLANYKRNKFRGGVNRYLTEDKTLLKDEVERKLELLVDTLNNKEEYLLVNEVMDIMDRLEVIFYE